jgi:hypothetical protein
MPMEQSGGGRREYVGASWEIRRSTMLFHFPININSKIVSLVPEKKSGVES